jgi:hypothetical protein
MFTFNLYAKNWRTESIVVLLTIYLVQPSDTQRLTFKIDQTYCKKMVQLSNITLSYSSLTKNNSREYFVRKKRCNPIKVSEPNWLGWLGLIFEKHQKLNQIGLINSSFGSNTKLTKLIQTGLIKPLGACRYKTLVHRKNKKFIVKVLLASKINHR